MVAGIVWSSGFEDEELRYGTLRGDGVVFRGVGIEARGSTGGRMEG
jgi:hypothetical protein